MLAHPTPWRVILILPSRPYLSISSGLFTSGSPLLSSIHAACPTHIILLDLVTWVQIIKLLIIVIPTPITSSLWGSNFLLSPRSYHNVSDQVSNPHKTTGKTVVLYNFIFLGSKLEDKRFCNEWQQAFPYFNLLWTRHLQNTTQKPNCSLKLSENSGIPQI